MRRNRASTFKDHFPIFLFFYSSIILKTLLFICPRKCSLVLIFNTFSHVVKISTATTTIAAAAVAAYDV